MTKKPDDDPVVTIVRSGYASDDLWLEAIQAALKHGRAVVIIDAEGRRHDAKLLAS